MERFKGRSTSEATGSLLSIREKGAPLTAEAKVISKVHYSTLL